MQHGAERLATEELLAILVGSGGIGHSALDTGRAILAEASGSLRRLRARPAAELTQIAGVGRARAVTIHAALELGRRWAEEPSEERPLMASPDDVVAMFARQMRDRLTEEFHVLVLDAKQRMQRDITVSHGLLSSTPVHPREVFGPAIVEGAASVVLLHNHPSGNSDPSPEDIRITSELVFAGRILGIPVHDHIIIGRGRHFSFLEARWL